uniref:Uncharacterized protein n=1 Tax=Clastoptera arizonana TaxID=38151 RepID=A0A1B6EG95_9HEMI
MAVLVSFPELSQKVLADDGDMLTTCPRCRHCFTMEPPCCIPAQPMVFSATLHLPLTNTSCTVSLTTNDSGAMLQKGVTMKTSGGNLVVSSCVPEPSPSAPVSFVLPSSPMANQGWVFPTHSETDLQRLSSTIKALRTSGWYYEGLSWQESASLLMPTSPGTFLVRDSSDPRFLFSLSVQTERGPTSVRIHYVNGNFRLDAEPKLAATMPVFACVVSLIDYYVKFTQARRDRNTKGQVWIDCAGQTYSSILLVQPLYQKGKFPRLQHLARLAVNRVSQNGGYVPTYGIPVTLQKYLMDYPFTQ